MTQEKGSDGRGNLEDPGTQGGPQDRPGSGRPRAAGLEDEEQPGGDDALRELAVARSMRACVSVRRVKGDNNE